MPACPECDTMIDVEEDLLEEGQTIECPECGAELEVVSIDPVEFEILSRNGDEEEDFALDDDDEEEEEEEL